MTAPEPQKHRTKHRTGANGGGKLLTGNPGNKGGGRKPAEWKDACAKVLQDAKALPVLGKIISGDLKDDLVVAPDGTPIFGTNKNSDRIGAAKFLAAYAHGAPQQEVEHSGSVTIKVEYDEG